MANEELDRQTSNGQLKGGLCTMLYNTSSLKISENNHDTKPWCCLVGNNFQLFVVPLFCIMRPGESLSRLF